MASTLVTGIGLVAAGLTTFSFLPQVVQTWRTRSARDLNLPMFLMLTFGIAMWLTYGILLGEWPIILANAVGILFSGAILYFKIRHG